MMIIPDNSLWMTYFKLIIKLLHFIQNTQHPSLSGYIQIPKA